MSKKLKGMRIAMLVADGFEQLEVTKPKASLEREGARVDVVSLRPGKLRGRNFIFRGRGVNVDVTLVDARSYHYDGLVLPGGFVSPDLLRQDGRALELVRNIDDADKPIAVICHGPELMISAGIVQGRTMTSWPGIADDVANAGGTWVDEPVVADRNWVSSRGPQDVGAFCDAMVQLFEAHHEPIAAAPPHLWLRRAAAVASAGGALLMARRLVR